MQCFHEARRGLGQSPFEPLPCLFCRYEKFVAVICNLFDDSTSLDFCNASIRQGVGIVSHFLEPRPCLICRYEIFFMDICNLFEFCNVSMRQGVACSVHWLEPFCGYENCVVVICNLFSSCTGLDFCTVSMRQGGVWSVHWLEPRPCLFCWYENLVMIIRNLLMVESALIFGIFQEGKTGHGQSLFSATLLPIFLNMNWIDQSWLLCSSIWMAAPFLIFSLFYRQGGVVRCRFVVMPLCLWPNTMWCRWHLFTIQSATAPLQTCAGPTCSSLTWYVHQHTLSAVLITPDSSWFS